MVNQKYKILEMKTKSGMQIFSNPQIKVYNLKMPQSQKCCQCFNYFSETRRPRELSCNHNICEPCIKQIQEDSTHQIIICQFCQTSFTKENLSELKLNQNIKLKIQENSNSEVKQAQNIINKDEGQSLLENQIQVLTQESIQNPQLCSLHNLTMDIICITDKVKICPHCALFGNHKNHLFKRFQDIQIEIKQKCKIFKQISAERQANKSNVCERQIVQLIKVKINVRKEELLKQIESQIQKFISILNNKRNSLNEQAQKYFSDLQEFLFQSKTLKHLEKSRTKFEKWQHNNNELVTKIESSQKLEQKINLYFNSPLQIVSEGFIYLSQLVKSNQLSINKINQKTSEVKLLIDSQMSQLLQKCMKLKKGVIGPLSSSIKEPKDQISQTNPFLDFTSSDIGSINHNFQQLNNSMEVDFSTLTKEWKSIEDSIMPSSHIKKPNSKKLLTSVKSIQKPEKGSQLVSKSNLVYSPKHSQIRFSRISQASSVRLPQKALKTGSSKTVLLEGEPKPYDPNQPQRLYAQFMKNSLADSFDLSDCNLSNQKVLQYIVRARRTHKFKGLKLCSNRLTSQGFENLIQYLKGVSNINIANNLVNEHIFEVIWKNRERIQALRILNLTHNPINFEKKSKAKFQQIKRMGIIVIL